MYVIKNFRDVKTGNNFNTLCFEGITSGIGDIGERLDFGLSNAEEMFSRIEVEVYDSENDCYKKLTLRELFDLFSKICSEDGLSKRSIKGYQSRYVLYEDKFKDIDKSNRFQNLENIDIIWVDTESFKASREGLSIVLRSKLFGYDIYGDGGYMYVPTYLLRGNDLVLPTNGTYIDDNCYKSHNIFYTWNGVDIHKLDKIVLPKEYPMINKSMNGLKRMIETLYYYRERKVLVYRETDYSVDWLGRTSIGEYGNLYCTGELEIPSSVRKEANSKLYRNRNNQYVSFFADDRNLVLVIRRVYKSGDKSEPEFIITEHDKGSDIMNHFSLDDPYIKAIIREHNRSLR